MHRKWRQEWKRAFYSYTFSIATTHLTRVPTQPFFIALFLCRKVTTTRWSEICDLTHLWWSSLFWNVRCIKSVMLLKMSSFTSMFEAFWPQTHLNLAGGDFCSSAILNLFLWPLKNIYSFFPQNLELIHFVGCWLAGMMMWS